MSRSHLSRSQLKSLPKQGRKSQAGEHNISVQTNPYTQPSNDSDNSDRNFRIVKATTVGSQQYEHIQKIAAELFATRGYRAVGVAEIGDAVGLGRGTLYYHISSKEDLLFSIVVRYIEDLVVAGRDALETEPDPRKRIYVLSRHLMRAIFSNLHEMTVSFREADCLTGQRHRIVSELHQSYQDIWMMTLREGEKKGHFRALPTVAIRGLLGMYFYSFTWLKPGGKRSSNDIADVFAEMTLAAAETTPLKKA